VWVGKTGRVNNINEEIADDLAPGFILAMFATLIKLPNIIATLALFLTWLLKIKNKEGMNKKHWLKLCVQMFLIMGVGIFLDPSINWIWMIILLGIFYIKNKLEQRIEKREEKEKKD
jgi:ribose/xylose/arabinose/galactoside ABC-type transport system permease subunit